MSSAWREVAVFLALLAVAAVLTWTVGDAHARPAPRTDPLTQAIDYHDRLEAFVARQEQAQESVSRSTRADPPAPVSGLPAGLLCVREHESGGDYQAVNSSSGAAGAYQLMPQYADDWAVRYGYPDWADEPVTAWPPAVQDGVALGLWNQTNGRAWSDFTTYTCSWP